MYCSRQLKSINYSLYCQPSTIGLGGAGLGAGGAGPGGLGAGGAGPGGLGAGGAGGYNPAAGGYNPAAAKAAKYGG